MSKVRDISNLSNVIRTDASGNVSFVSGSTTLATINTSGQLSGSSPVLSSSYALNADLLDGLDSTQFTLTSSFAAQTASFTAFTASVNSFTASQLVLNGTYATTGSNTFAGIQTINSNLVVTGSITAQTLVVQTITSSVDFVTGSTRFGSSLSTSTHQFTGSVSITGSVGIGTTTPSGLLQVGVANSGIYFDTTTQYTPKIKAAGTISDIQIESVGSGGNVYLTAPGATSLIAMSVSGSEKLRITAAGNVGIGTSSPTAKLEVKGIADGDLFIGRFHAGSAKLIYAYQLGSDGYLELRTGADAIITKLSGYSGTPSYFLSNVGVGTITPNVKFEVGADTQTGAEYSAYTTNTSGGITSKYSFWRNYTVGGSSPFRAAYIANNNEDDSNNSNNKQHLTFATKSGTAEPTEKMRITADGFVSIGQFPAPSNVQVKIRTTSQSTSTYALGIDNSVADLFYVRNDGIVIAPLQPSFSMGNGAASTGPGIVPFLRTIYNDGSHFNISTYRFTAPAAGRYFFSFYDNIMANSTAAASFEFRVNGTRRGAMAYTSTKTTGNWYLISFQQVLKLSAGDYVEVGNNSVDSPDYGGDTSWGNFSGHFLG